MVNVGPGYRQVRLCKCGCGKQVGENIINGRFKGYLKYAVGCDYRKWTENAKNKLINTLKEKGHPGEKEIGTKRIAHSKEGKYWQIKTSKSKRWSYEHRYLMEQKLGRKLTKNEIVHHKDENTLNNNLDNLEVMTKGQHSYLHSKLRGFDPRLTAKLPEGKWARHYDKCIICNTTRSHHSSKGVCNNCYRYRYRRNNAISKQTTATVSSLVKAKRRRPQRVE